MVKHTHKSGSGTADLETHQRTWHGFLALIKWSVIAILAVMAYLAIFRVN
jgi:hypothetical protein